ncbi:MAG TPA: shikimate kinase [Bryobacteraceae bacterium]|nr:shikimate kinase [Bryobacteraceae bacterium]
MNLKLKRTPGIYLIGFMGSGKSTIGRMLAEEIGWRFVDLDEDIEHEQHKSIPELFRLAGEAEFRRLETEAIAKRVRHVRCGIPTVIALGGGAFTREENIEMLNENGITVWIDTALSVCRRRVNMSEHRPLARDPQMFEQLYHKRRESYGRAEYRLQVNEDNSRQALHDLLGLRLFS